MPSQGDNFIGCFLEFGNFYTPLTWVAASTMKPLEEASASSCRTGTFWSWM